MDIDFSNTINKTILFDKKMELFNNSEFIPNSLLNELINYYIPSAQIIHNFNESHFIITCKIKDLLETSVINWEYNRPPDKIRCLDIANYIYNSKRPIDTLFYLHYNNNKKAFEVLDGIHRFTALKLIKYENEKPRDFICPGDFGSDNDAKWLMQDTILINLRFNCPLGILIEVFKSLNKSNPVPDLYIRDSSKEKRNIIESIANSWQINYKSHFSINSKPNKPNINRDRFIELLDKLYDKYKINEENKYILENLLEHANIYLRRNIPKKISKIALEKCLETGCYLFLVSIEKLENLI
jgi:hypothetical protein